MGQFLHTASLLSATAAAGLFAAIWQGAVLAVGVTLCLRLMPGLSAAARSLVWMNVFALLVLLHILPGFAGNGVSTPSSALTAPLHFDPRWSLGLLCAWAAISLCRGAGLLLSGLRLHRMARRATPVPFDLAQRALLILPSNRAEISHPCARKKAQGWGTGSQYSGIGSRGLESHQAWVRDAVLCTSAEVDRPCVFGFLRPRILLPTGLIETLSPLDLSLVLEHELEHLRRADDWSNLIQKIALAVFPLNPALLWVERRLCAERELACDDHVLNSSAGVKAYATCLTRLAEYTMLSRGLSLVLGALDRRSELVRRVHRILSRPHASMSARAAMAASAALVLCALGGALGLARSPQLVSFAPPAAVSVPEPSLAFNALPPINPQPAQARPQLVKAVLPPRPHKASAHLFPATRNMEDRVVDQLPVEPQQQWIVLTEWHTEEAPPPVVFTVVHRVRPSYAAVPFEDGWLIVQI